MSSCRCRCGCIPNLRPCATSTETDERPTSDEGGGGDANADSKSDRERQRDGDMGNDDNIADFNQEEGSDRYLTPEQDANHPHRLLATGPGCARGDIVESAQEAQCNGDYDRGEEADTTRMLESILKEFSLVDSR